ncbi:glycoside hydrolase/deacetylase [Schizophyllum commune H4-8]|nr:glycoside hydrolase/deacetylase [Schizophyllum commune H4-8]KAI5899931.1 glycoside hydrolase/deacetylase [Schizophyllum commune H4-8]
MYIFSALPSLTLGATSAATTAQLAARQSGTQVITSCANSGDAALTFDDGPYIYEKDIVDTLDAAGAKGTFFLNGQMQRCIYDNDMVDNLLYAYNRSHQLASHTWSHPHLTQLSADQMNQEMQRVEEALQKTVGVVPAFLRPPYGDTNDQVTAAASSRGYSALVVWNFDSNDWAGASAATVNSNYDSIASQHPDSIITLNHETIEQTAHTTLMHAIQTLQSAGYNLVTVAECMGLEPYQSVGEPSTRDSTWTC